MGQTFEFRDPIDFPVDDVLAKVTDADFIAQWAIVQQGVNPRVKMLEKSDDKVLYTIDLEEPLPKPFGTMKAHMDFKWDLKARKLVWTRKGEGISNKAQISGESEVLVTSDNSCEYVERITIHIPIPMIGKKAEKQVAKYLQESRPAKMNFLKSKLEG